VRIVRLKYPRIALLFILPDSVLVIVDLGSRSVPSNVFLGCMSLRVDQDFHALIVQRVRLAQVEHVEAHITFDCVLHSEEEPLRMAPRIHIVLQQ
jgi:hypothetical protein